MPQLLHVPSLLSGVQFNLLDQSLFIPGSLFVWSQDFDILSSLYFPMVSRVKRHWLEYTPTGAHPVNLIVTVDQSNHLKVDMYCSFMTQEVGVKRVVLMHVNGLNMANGLT